MKRSTIMLLAAYSLCSGCTSRQPTVDTDIVIAIDRTDPLTTVPSAEDITSPLRLQADMWQGIQVRVTSISELDINASEVVSLERSDEWSGNAALRAAEVKRFGTHLQAALASVPRGARSQHSVVYRTIARQANALARSRAIKKHLIVVSDLRENSEIDFYDPQTVRKLRSDPSSVEKRLRASHPLGNLAGLHVWLLYNPSSYDDNGTYMAVAALYRHMLGQQGATVHIGNKFLPL